MAIMKYAGQAADDGGKPLFWPGHQGLPIRAEHAPTVREEELDARFTVQHDFRSREFDLGDPAQKAEYDAIMDRIVNQWYVQLLKEHYRDPATGRRVVYLEWTQRYGALTPTAAQLFHPGASSSSSIAKVG